MGAPDLTGRIERQYGLHSITDLGSEQASSLRWAARAVASLGRPAPIILVPGIDGSGPGHWQALWARSLPGAELLEQNGWARPDPQAWLERLASMLHRRPGALLVGHSLGCMLIAMAAKPELARRIAVALLVAPADVDRDGPGHARLRAHADRRPTVPESARSQPRRPAHGVRPRLVARPCLGLQLSRRWRLRAYQHRLGPRPLARRLRLA